jgi:LmbE family N-acetylglucosaminyl deacetylase
VVAAHPDDETIGVGGHLASLPRATLVYLTDGAPRDGRDARDRGFSTPAEYAKARRRELEQALAIAGVPPGRCVHLGVADQEAALHLSDLALELAHFFAAGKPHWVLSHAYEGGHPDHDAAAFVVHAAATLVRHRGSEPPAVLEFASYHAREGGVEVGTFLPPPPELAGADDVAIFELTDEQRRVKAEMLACYETQRHVLSAFPLDREAFRPAPVYDFRAPPHPGPLYYEAFPWGLTSARWLELAAEASIRLRLAGQ